MLEPISSLLQLEQITGDVFVTMISGFGIGNYLKAIKYSILDGFEQPRIALRISGKLNDYITGEQVPESIKSVSIDFVVSNNKLLFLGFINEHFTSSLIDTIDNMIDTNLGLSGGTFSNLSVRETIELAYQISQDETFIGNLPIEYQDFVRGMKDNIDDMVSWNGYENISDFLDAISLLEGGENEGS